MALKHFKDMGYQDDKGTEDFRNFMAGFEDNACAMGGLDLYDVGYSSLSTLEKITPVKGEFDYDDTQFKIDDQGMLKYIGSEMDGSKINIPHGVINLSGTFAGTGITSLPKIPDTVIDINGAFAGCTQLTAVSGLPDSIVFADGAFENCTGIKSVDFPETSCFFSLDNAFRGCTSLQTVNLHELGADSMTSTFEGCTALTDVTGSVGFGHYGSGKNGDFSAFFEDLDDIPMGYDSTFEGCTNLKSAPDFGMAHLGTMSRTFANCTSLQQLGEIPSAVYEMEETFANCTSLKTARIPQGGNGPFQVTHMIRTYSGCTSLENIDELSTSKCTVDMQDVFADCPIIAEQKRQQAIKEHREHKKEKTGLNNPVVAYSMGGAVKSPYVPDAGIRVLEYNSSLPIDSILRKEQENITVAVGDVIGGEETGKERFLVGKPVTKDGKTYLPMIYSGFTSENEGEIDEAVRYFVEHTIKDAKLPDGSFVGRQGWKLEDTIYRPTESQLQNAVERYTPSVGTWVGKNIDKPIALNTSLVKEMENDGLQNNGNNGLG